MGAHFDENRRRTQPMAEEAGVEPTEDAWRPPTGLKPARVTGPDALPRPILQVLCTGSKVEAPAASDQANTSLPRNKMRVSPVRRVAPILSKYSRIWIARLRPTPQLSLKLAAVKVPSGELSASSRAISARRARVSGRKKRFSATRATRPSRSARLRKRSTAS